jgi:hypothetical protein
MLTTAQKATLKTDVLANSDTLALYNAGNHAGLAAQYNLDAVPDYWVWRTSVPINEVGNTFNATELAGLTSLNTQRLQNLAAWSSVGVNPTTAGVRQFFDDIFSGAGGAITRPALLVLWRRKANRFEKVFATGAGTTAAPSLLGLEGALSTSGSDFIGM